MVSPHRPNDRMAGKKADYGIDRPDLVSFLALVGVVSLLLTVISFLPLETGLLVSLISFVFAASFVVGSKTGKVSAARKLLDSIPWRGDESVLDIGCGRGLMLVTAAKHLTTGRAFGIDIWNRRLQSGNSPEKTLENARIEGVADRVEVKNGDARRRLSFANETFDVVVTSLVFHHIPVKERRGALAEIVRVLKPGGELAMIELFHAKEYATVLRELGMSDIAVSSPRVFLFFGSRTLRGRKSLSADGRIVVLGR